MRPSLPQKIAIIGMGCEFPGAHSSEALWQNVLAGRRYFRKAPPERLPADYFDPDPSAKDKSYCDLMAVLEGWHFDPVEFGIAPVTFLASDMAHWLALSVARAAIADAGLDLPNMERTRIGVVLGNTLTGEFMRSHYLRNRWPYVERAMRRALQQQRLPVPEAQALLAALRQQYQARLPASSEDSLAGSMSNTIAGRICSYFDLGGGGYVVDGACSSSLLSLAHACQSLLNGDLNVVIAGGVDISLDPFEIIGFAKTRALAADDIRPYDARAAGMLPGEGCGLFVLMREAHARHEGHRIHALITGWGISSDGAGSITAPTIAGQTRALKSAYRRAGYPLASVGLIEGHGTGTALGDRIEISALQQLLTAETQPGVCHLGSIKGQIGHCKAAAGAAGLIKAVMALKRKIYPPSGNCQQPHPLFTQTADALRPLLRGMPWPASQTPRRAAVSAMGFGGANAHVTLEESNPNALPPASDLALLGSAQSSELVLLSAATLAQLRQQIARLSTISGRICRADLTDLSAALCQASPTESIRLAIVANSPWELASTLQRLLQQLDQGSDLADLHQPEDAIYAGVAQTRPVLAALFPGQGSQYLHMGDHLRRRYPFLAPLYDGSSAALSALVFPDLESANDITRAHRERQLRATEVAQPAIVQHSMATLALLQNLGLNPDVAVGHSLGEISALAAGGAWTAATAIEIARLRGNAIASLPLDEPGAMLALAATPEQSDQLLQQWRHDLRIANFNSPRQTVISGSTSGIDGLLIRCRQAGIPARKLAVSHAFHSDLVAPAGDMLSNALKAAGIAPMRNAQTSPTSVVSSSTTLPVTAATDLGILLAEQIRQPVHFTQAIRKAAERQPALWLEVGPGNALSGLVRDILDDNNVPVMATDIAGEDGFHLLNRVLAQAFALGFPLATEKLFSHRFHRRFEIDHFHPQFIVNPCEQGWGKDAVNHTDHPVPTPAAPYRPMPTAGTGRPSQPAAIDRTALFSFAVEWLVQRTGFPQQLIQPATKLRDDLNLDSIKTSELITQMAKKAGKSLSIDPLSMSNATIDELLTQVLTTANHASAPGPQSSVQTPTFTARKAAEATTADSPAPWINTFQMTNVAAPIETEAARALTTPASVALLGDQNQLSKEMAAITSMLHQHQLRTYRPQWDANEGKEPAQEDARWFDSAVFIWLMPTAETPFFSCTPDEFRQRVEVHASTLFQLFRQLLTQRSATAPPWRGLLVRARHDEPEHSADADAGAAFIRTLLLEYPDLEIKWINLPPSWPASQWARIIEQELQNWGHNFISYMPSGQRCISVAKPVPQLPEEASLPSLPLGAADVVLVSGGAKGITFELALELHRHSQVALALIGTSPRAALGDEVLAHFSELERRGIRYCYLQADVTDAAAVIAAVAVATTTLGPVRAILHGAGISQLQLLRDKNLNDYLHCIRVKTSGLYNLINAVGHANLKALHVVSSVLGSTGMRGQIDYAFANAWLDGAVRAFKFSHPQTHCLSLGYSVWSDTGLGHKLGTLDALTAAGVTPIPTRQGVRAYDQLLQTVLTTTQFIISGRLTGPLEKNLYGAPPADRPRFLETIMRWIPGQEILAQAALSHEHDLYLAEHVHEGTPLFPAVMAIEAMVQIAQACAGRSELPVLRDILFKHPVIVTTGSETNIRLLALAEPATGHQLCIRVTIRSDASGYQQNHVEACCWFGLPELLPDQRPVFPALPPVLADDPEQCCPVPLFQGKFFRRISAIRQRHMGVSSLTDITAPTAADTIYYNKQWPSSCVTPSPVVRDALLQSGALALPPGYLPLSLGELRFRHTEASRIHCVSLVKQHGASDYLCDLSAFDNQGHLLETMRDLQLQRSLQRTQKHERQRRAPVPLPTTRVEAVLDHVLAARPHGLALCRYDEPHSTTTHPAVPAPATLRARMTRANRLATQAAARRFAQRYLPQELSPPHIRITHRADGKPLLYGTLPAAVHLSLSHSAGASVALLAQEPLGIDLEVVACRTCETWRALLAMDGYALALRIQVHTGESFDCAATRVWTMLEIARKADLPRPTMSAVRIDTGADTLTLNAGTQGENYISLLLQHPTDASISAALTLTISDRQDINY